VRLIAAHAAAFFVALAAAAVAAAAARAAAGAGATAGAGAAGAGAGGAFITAFAVINNRNMLEFRFLIFSAPIN